MTMQAGRWLVAGGLGAQNAICSGGRYDGLFEQLGGRPTPGCGFGIGVERALLLLDGGALPRDVPDAYLVRQGERAARERRVLLAAGARAAGRSPAHRSVRGTGAGGRRASGSTRRRGPGLRDAGLRHRLR